MCTLRAAGREFDVDRFLATSSIKAIAVYHAGSPKSPGNPKGPRVVRSGFNAEVSTRDWSDLAGQIEDAKAFLGRHGSEIRRLAGFAGCEGIEIDFPMKLRIGTDDLVVQTDTFPAELLLLAGTLGVNLTFSLYPPSNARGERR